MYIYIYINSQEHLSEKPTFNFIKTSLAVKIDETDDAWGKKKKTTLASYVLQQNSSNLFFCLVNGIGMLHQV